ncbi:MAG: EFR1 family ferrodoxin [Candidatus Omnitrophica bacterium]|nr:EFR1 family ferrodoxin [Candidatus Omnitrophota bacterium]
MTTTIFYFTGTGNCLKVARDLAKALDDTKITSISKVLNGEIDLSTDRIGIIYPVYMFGMPLIVSRFIKKLSLAKDKYIFAIATYGGMPGGSLGQTARELKAIGLKLSAGFGIAMPGNYTPLYGAIDKNKQKSMFVKETKRIVEIASIIREKKDAKIEENNFLTNAIFSGLIYKASSPKIPYMDKDFWSDDKCNSCGTCVKVCPVNNIKLFDKKPAWMHKCEQCFACLQWCPKEAIQYGKNTATRTRYHHPEIKLQDIIAGKV